MVIDLYGHYLILNTHGESPPEYLTLKEIGGIPTKDIKDETLCSFHVGIGLRGQGKMKKHEIAQKSWSLRLSLLPIIYQDTTNNTTK